MVKLFDILQIYTFGRRFILYIETKLHKDIYALQKICALAICHTDHKCKNLADNLTSISIGPSCTAYIVLMTDCSISIGPSCTAYIVLITDCECQLKPNAQ